MATDNAWIGEGDVKVYFVNNNEEDEEVLESFRRKTSQGVFQDIIVKVKTTHMGICASR